MSFENRTVPKDASPSKRAAVKPLNPDALAHEPQCLKLAPQHIPSVNQPAEPPISAFVPFHSGTPLPVMGGYTNGWVQPASSAMTDQEFFHTRSLLPHVQRPALAAVLQSLMDDFPQFAPLIRVRCEKAMAVVMQNMPQQPLPIHTSVNGNTPPNLSPSLYGGGTASQEHTPIAAGGSNRKARRPREEETEVCGLHGGTRSMKHLQLNPVTKHWECVPGFHCLESSGASNLTSPSIAGMPTISPVKAPQVTPMHFHSSAVQEEDTIDVKRLETLLQDLRQA